MRTFSNSMLLLAALALASGATVAATEPQNYGAGVQTAEATSVAKILADPDAYVGKKVRIEGKVTDVCPMAGCWMEVDDAGKTIKVKVDDGVIVFPATSKGKLAAAEGVLESIPMERDRYVAWMEHLAEERGDTFDAASVGEGPFRILQLKGTGAKLD